MTEEEKDRTTGEEESAEDKRMEGGRPGNGKGRKDEVGRSGVYPMSSSEEAAEEAEVRDEASWGQGERGAAGYEDHGDSGLEAFWRSVREREREKENGK